MAMLTCGAVLVDILPSYKITKLSEVQMKEKVKKDLKILRQYEQGIKTIILTLKLCNSIQDYWISVKNF